MDIQDIIRQMTAEEKSAIVAGTDFMYTNELPRLNIPALCMADGPHGLRKQSQRANTGVADSEPATAFPTAATVACSFNPDNTRLMGEAIGQECRHYGVHLLLGPGVNIKRNPLCGRNFEYFSEDPLLAAAMGSAQVKGLKTHDIGCAVKHFALNNNENYRFVGDSVADERAKREIYLRAFERIVKEASPATLMSAYNRVDGEYCAQNDALLNILRQEWGYDGAVMTDWGAMHDRIAALNAGTDLEMPGDTAICRRQILDGLQDGTLDTAVLDKAVKNVLRVIKKCYFAEESTPMDIDAHHELAANIAADSAVLLKNENNTLPLDSQEKFCIIGELFDKMRYQGSGSSMVNAAKITTPRAAFDVKGTAYTYARGYCESATAVDNALIDEALRIAQPFSHVVVFAGLTDAVESESGDREDMCLPQNQVALIEALIAADKRIVLVLFGGSPVELPFWDHIDAALHMYLPGQNGGTAVHRLLFGDVNPSGRLAESWPMTYEDVPFGDEYQRSPLALYKESVFVGYRYYTACPDAVRFPFGHGLSYTSFEYSDMHLSVSKDSVTVDCLVTNTGAHNGSEVVQLYISAPQSDVIKPVRELRAFQKVYLRVGESRRISLSVPLDDLRYYHIGENRWVMESGKYTFSLCRDSATVITEETVVIEGEDTPSPYDAEACAIYSAGQLPHITNEQFAKACRVTPAPVADTLPLTVDSRFDSYQQTRGGRLLYRTAMWVLDVLLRRAARLPAGQERDNKMKEVLFNKKIIASNSISGMTMNAGKRLPYNIALAAVALANGQLGRMVYHLSHPIKVPPLPRHKK